MKRKNRSFILVMTLLLVCTAAFAFARTAQAYTEEEKAQAKAWLSAHGYSPDYGGASQAYQDYLDGKFDEELGITTNTEAETTEENAAGDDAAKTEKETAQDKEKENKAPGPKKENPGLSGEKNYAKAETAADGKGNTVDVSGEVSDGQTVRTEENTQTMGAPSDASAGWLMIDAGIDNTKAKKRTLTIIFLSVVVMILLYEGIKTARTKEFKEARGNRRFSSKGEVKDIADSEEEEMKKKAGM